MGDQLDHQNDMEWRVLGVESILDYKFKNKKLLEEALTHPTCVGLGATSYQRLEFIGDAVLAMAFSEFFFSEYPKLGEKELSLLKQANTTNEKLARVAVRYGLYRFLRTPATVPPDQKVQEFILTVQQEEEEIETTVFGGTVKACKVLADIVESVAAAVYFDCGSDLKVVWRVIADLLEPIVTPETLPTHPVTKLFEMCQKHGKEVNIKASRDHNTNKCSIYVDKELFGVGCSDQNKDIAELKAAKEALVKLNLSDMNRDMANLCVVNDSNENEAAMQKLHNLCAQRKWVKPSYTIEKEEGPPHDKKFTCSVEIETVKEKVFAWGDEKSRVGEAKNSAASSMIRKLAKSSL